MSNPYLVAGEDDDLFDDPHTHTSHNLDGEYCPICGLVHTINSQDELPPEIKKKISEYLDTLPPGVKAEIIEVIRNDSSGYLQQFRNFYDQTLMTNSSGPLVRALIESLDAITNGDVSKRWKLYVMERDVICAFIILKACRTVFDEPLPEEATLDATTAMTTLMERILEECQNKLTHYIEVYTRECEVRGVEIDISLIEKGMHNRELENLDWIDRFMQPFPLSNDNDETTVSEEEV